MKPDRKGRYGTRLDNARYIKVVVDTPSFMNTPVRKGDAQKDTLVLYFALTVRESYATPDITRIRTCYKSTGASEMCRTALSWS